MIKVLFIPQGRFGNNLIQYFAAEIIKKIYNLDDVGVYVKNSIPMSVINDRIFKDIVVMYLNGEKYPLDISKDIYMYGFFQRSDIFKYEREYIKSLFNIDNTHYINNRIQICNISKYKSKHLVEPGKNDIVIHIRLDDFKEHGIIYDADSIKDFVKTLFYDKLYIVCDKIKDDWENTYITNFNDLNPIFINGNMGDDFDFLMKAPRIIISASTYSWIAAYLGNSNQCYIPTNLSHENMNDCYQLLSVFGDNCKLIDFKVLTK